MKKQNNSILDVGVQILERHVSLYTTWFTKKKIKCITIIYLDKRLNTILTHQTEFEYEGLTNEEMFAK